MQCNDYTDHFEIFVSQIQCAGFGVWITERFIIFFINIYIHIYYTGLSVCFLCEKDSHLLQYNENSDAYLTSGSIKCINKLKQLVVDGNAEEIILFIPKSTFYCIVSTRVEQGCCTGKMKLSNWQIKKYVRDKVAGSEYADKFSKDVAENVTER